MNNILSSTFDVIVIGAGGIGSATAYHLAQDGKRVLLLEQFQIGHQRGSSHGGSRMIRYTHDTLDYAQVMPATFDLWRRLEQVSGQRLLQMTGGLFIAPEADPFFSQAQDVLTTLGSPYRLLTKAQLQQDYPQFHLPAQWSALEQENSGILAANRCVATLISQASHHGATVREHTRVIAVEPTAAGVAVRSERAGVEETLYAAQAIITAGPWATQLLGPLIPQTLPLKVTHQQYGYFPVDRPEWYAAGRCPLYLFMAAPYFYGFPIYELPGHIKVGIELRDTGVDPDQPRVVDPTVHAELEARVGEILVGVQPKATRVDLCLYTETPNRDFIIDRHPDHPQILFGTGFSGRGFKFVISIGRLLADLAQSAPGSYDSQFWLERFALQRFRIPTK